MQAREAFAAGRYQEALDIYVKLYAEKLHPNYLRNIGRCYQNLGDPDKAIGSFREYLRKARNLPPGSAQEIEGYIREMEELKRQRAAAAAAGGAEAGPPPRRARRRRLPRRRCSRPRRRPRPAESPPVYKRWWFWTAVGVAVVGGTVAVVLATSGNKDLPCECRPGMQLNRPTPGAALGWPAGAGGRLRGLGIPGAGAGGHRPGPVAGIKSVEIAVSEVRRQDVKRQSFDWTAARARR